VWPSNLPVDICATNPNISACQSFPAQLDLCVAHPGIAACATAPAAPSSLPAPGGSAVAGFQAVYNHLMSKAPFGYVNQAVTALTGTFSGAAGADATMCWDLGWPPPGVHWCIPDYSADASSIRALMLVFVTIVFGMVAFGMATRAPDGND
jgi:hypothetical protein